MERFVVVALNGGRDINGKYNPLAVSLPETLRGIRESIMERFIVVALNGSRDINGKYNPLAVSLPETSGDLGSL